MNNIPSVGKIVFYGSHNVFVQIQKKIGYTSDQKLDIESVTRHSQTRNYGRKNRKKN